MSIVPNALVTIHKNFGGNWTAIIVLFLLFLLILMTISISFGVRVFLDSKSTADAAKKLIFALFFAILTVNTFIFGFARIFDLKNLHPYLHQHQNRIRILSQDSDDEMKMMQESHAFHDSLEFVADLHCDTLMYRYRGTLDNNHPFGLNLRTLQKGNVALQVFSSVTQYPLTLTYFGVKKNTTDVVGFVLWSQLPILEKFSRKGLRLLTSRKERARSYSESLERSVAKNPETLKFIKSKADFQKFVELRKSKINRKVPQSEIPIGALLSIESLHAIDSDKAGISELWDLGVRMVGLSHFTDDAFGSCASGVGATLGLGFSDKKFSESVLSDMVSRKMIIDVAHSSEFLVSDVIRSIPADYPIMISHTGVQGTCNNSRNLDDKFISEITRRSGLIGIAMFDKTTCTPDLAGTIAAMKYVKNLVGHCRSLALGSDADGLVATIPAQQDFWEVTHALLKEGFTKEEVKLIMGENVKNFMLKYLP